MNWPNNRNGWPLSRKKTVRLLIGLTLLAWATQTLLAQWGWGAQVPESPADEPALATAASSGEEKFVPGTARFAAGATIELRDEATIIGEEIRLKQIARWSQQDDAVLAPLGDLILGRIERGRPFQGIGLEEIKQTLQAAGVNIAPLNFVGATSCTVNRSDIDYQQGSSFHQWIQARLPATQPTTPPADHVTKPAENHDKPVCTLREMLVGELAGRLGVEAASLQMNFKPQDEPVLNLSEPIFRFEIEPQRGRNLGEVSWLVRILADQQVQKVNIVATARAWQDQLVVSRPLSFKQIIRDEDLIARRTLVDRLPDEPLLSRAQAVGQQAARELRPGTVLTSRMIEAVQLVKTGQYVTIMLRQGTVSIRTVARALEAGSYGQTIRVKNESTKDVFQVTLTGPQTATMNLDPSQDADLASAGN